MPIAVTSVDVNTHTFGNWIDYFNTVAEHMTGNVISIGTTATGDANQNGQYNVWTVQANLVNANTGNVVTFTSNTMQTNSANIANGTGHFSTLTLGGNTVLTSANFDTNTVVRTNANATLAETYIFSNEVTVKDQVIDSNTIVLTSTSANIIHSWNISNYRAAKYVVSVSNPTTNNYSVREILVMHDNETAYITEYAQLHSNTDSGVFVANIDTGNMRLFYTPAAASNTVVTQSRTLISE